MHTVFTSDRKKTAGESRGIHPASGYFGGGEIDLGMIEAHKAAKERHELTAYSGSNRRRAGCKGA